ncbi:TlpA disulfide reductase family protein [Cytophaga aurantiaca]|uniref:TlpA disulfide reductase family protein n=1 Tax=Cytophaga aurantiaca TaxID=29530 RepID=UPI00036512D9|nr:TlpA disulfide reductase family protein [Cytophaga aurantiaca]
MKYIKRVAISLVAFLFLVLVANAKPISIKGKLIKTGYSTIYLYKYLGTTISVYDSTHYKEGVFEFKYKDVIPTGFYKVGFDKVSAITIIAGYENILITGNPDIERSISITESKENDAYILYRKVNKTQNAQNEALNKTAQDLQKMPGMTEELFNQYVVVLRAKSDSLNKAYNAEMVRISTAYPGSFMTKVISMFMYEGKTAETLFTPAEFTDKQYAAGDMLDSKVQSYFQYFVPQDLNAWKAASEKLLAACPAGSDNKQVFYAAIIPLFSQNDLEYAKGLCNRYISEYPSSELAKELKSKLPKGAAGIGEPVPDIVSADANGNKVSLSSLKGKVVLIDFWASWCGPCRGENPNVVAAYNLYKDKGFTVFSVSLDNNKDQWLAAIAKDGLVWPNHVSDLKGWQSDAAKLYNVKGIPATFLIDQEGNLIATNLRGEELKAKLAELLNKP